MDKLPTKAETVVTPSPENSPEQSIFLYSLNRSLQTGLLANLISDAMAVECRVIHDTSAQKSGETKDGGAAAESQAAPDLILIDCQGHDIQNLRALVSDINDLEADVHAALLNAEYGSEHEELLDWPCISGIFFSDTAQEQLLRGLRSLLRGEYWVPRRLLHHFLEKNRRAPSVRRNDIKLTKREKQILKLIKDGATNLDIASALDVSEHTVKSHLYNVYKKIGVRNRLEASNWVRDLEDF